MQEDNYKFVMWSATNNFKRFSYLQMNLFSARHSSRHWFLFLTALLILTNPVSSLFATLSKLHQFRPDAGSVLSPHLASIPIYVTGMIIMFIMSNKPNGPTNENLFRCWKKQYLAAHFLKNPIKTTPHFKNPRPNLKGIGKTTTFRESLKKCQELNIPVPAKQIFDAYIVNTGNCDFVRASGGEMKVGSLRKLEIAYYT